MPQLVFELIQLPNNLNNWFLAGEVDVVHDGYTYQLLPAEGMSKWEDFANTQRINSIPLDVRLGNFNMADVYRLTHISPLDLNRITTWAILQDISIVVSQLSTDRTLSQKFLQKIISFVEQQEAIT